MIVVTTEILPHIKLADFDFHSLKLRNVMATLLIKVREYIFFVGRYFATTG
jgi:hypothetical protein